LDKIVNRRSVLSGAAAVAAASLVPTLPAAASLVPAHRWAIVKNGEVPVYFCSGSDVHQVMEMVLDFLGTWEDEKGKVEVYFRGGSTDDLCADMTTYFDAFRGYFG
jgi:hypothetical protein